MTTALGVASWCSCELITIKDLGHTITEMGPTAELECSELQEADTNVTPQDIFTQKDIRDEIGSTYMTQPEHLSDVRALGIEGLSLKIGYDTIVEHKQGITVMIAEMPLPQWDQRQ